MSSAVKAGGEYFGKRILNSFLHRMSVLKCMFLLAVKHVITQLGSTLASGFVCTYKYTPNLFRKHTHTWNNVLPLKAGLEHSPLWLDSQGCSLYVTPTLTFLRKYGVHESNMLHTQNTHRTSVLKCMFLLAVKHVITQLGSTLASRCVYTYLIFSGSTSIHETTFLLPLKAGLEDPPLWLDSQGRSLYVTPILTFLREVQVHESNMLHTQNIHPIQAPRMHSNTR